MKRWQTIVCTAGLILSSTISADTITMTGTTIPMRDCEIQAIRDGQIHFRDSSGRRQQKSIESVQAIGFDGLPALDAAEKALLAGDRKTAIRWLLQARVHATLRAQEMWIHIRLAQYHGVEGQYAESAAHAALVFMLDDRPYWRILQPTTKAGDTSALAADEARRRLLAAKANVVDPVLSRAVDEMLETISQMDAGAPAVDANTITFSGLTIDEIMSWQPADAAEGTTAASAEQPSGTATVSTDNAPNTEPSTRLPPSSLTPSLERIRAAIDAGEISLALEACEALARDPIEDNVPDLLHQYGRALRAKGRPDEALVMWGRCVVEFPDSPAGLRSLLELAGEYSGRLNDRDTATRLLERAATLAGESGRRDIEDVARSLLERFSASLREEGS